VNPAHLLQYLLRERAAPDWYTGHETTPDPTTAHSLHRLARAFKDAGASPLDLAVLTRQCLRRIDREARVSSPVREAELPSDWRRVGISVALDGGVVAAPYTPDWVADPGDCSLDYPRDALAASQHTLAGEPWLQGMLGKEHWKSQAQKEVAWRALTAPENSTVLVGLPTGAGKSLVGQCCAAFDSGLTVLVVPTIALGIDQLAAVRELPCQEHLQPMLYPGQDPESTLAAVGARECRLLITSPEAIVAGRLRAPLRRLSAEGSLSRLVVDEAHLIESWGADFRVEFQLLGATLREWRSEAPRGIKALLLSATFTPAAPAALKEMFAGDGIYWEEHVVQRLRPEIHYFATSRWLSEEEQVHHVMESLLLLPRPAILYVTEVAKAEEWGKRLREVGLNRFRVFHGNTLPGARQSVMDAWREDRLDLVVATSAFGMGLDKPDVRAVVHACFPENIDRFYQEVGRGGRDGYPCVSLLVPTWRDRGVGQGMGPTLLADPDKIRDRWLAMWRSRGEDDAHDGNTPSAYWLRTDTSPEHMFGQQTYLESVKWNKRLLLLMERAGVARLIGMQSKQDASGKWVERVGVELRVLAIGLEERLADLLCDQRAQEQSSNRASTAALINYFQGHRCVCSELRAHYGPHTWRACGSCRQCRTGTTNPANPVPLRIDLNDQRAGDRPRVQVVQVPALRLPNSGPNPDLVRAVRQLLQAGMRRFVVPEHRWSDLNAIFQRAEDGVARPYRVDRFSDGPTDSIELGESVVAIHVGSLDDGGSALNAVGHSVTHWVSGIDLEANPSQWPYMYEHGARPYLGRDGLSNWLRGLARA
jgi:ATP-dependent DNA helicase RecQ